MNGLELSYPVTPGLAIYPPGATFGPRKMLDYEFVWIIEGDSEYRVNNVNHPAPAGTIVLCRPGTIDAFRWCVDKRTRHGFFHFNVLSLPKDWPGVESWPFARYPLEGDVLRPLFRHVMTWAGKGNEMLCRLSMAHMLTAYVCGEIGAGDLPREPMPDAVERALTHIYDKLEDAPASEISLTELSRVACVTSEHLCRLFKTATNHSPVETVRLARLDRAAVFLSRSNYSVGEIATMCGFASQFHFSRRFKEAFGKAPRQVRADIQAGGAPPMSRLLRRDPRV